ncbi:hypothetical protein ACWGVN_27035, partial [Streptomyces sp. NPDC055607]
GWGGLPFTVRGGAVLLGGVGGEMLVVNTDHNADFLSRVEAFDRAADTVEAWEAEYGPAPAPAPAAATR